MHHGFLQVICAGGGAVAPPIRRHLDVQRPTRFLRIAVLASLLLILAGCGAHPSVLYLVTVDPSDPHAIRVAADWQDVPRDSFVLGGFESAENLRLSAFEVTDAVGRRIPVRSRVGTIEAQGRAIRVPQYLVVGPLPYRIRVHYRVDPDIREGNDHVGFSGIRYGYVGERFAAIGGRNLFLLPVGGKTPRSIRVRFSLPTGWMAVTPWPRRGDAFRPGLDGRYTEEHLIASTLAFGPFTERRVALGRTRYRFAFLAGTPDSTATLAALESAAGTVRSILGRDLGPDYVTAILPPTPDGSDIHGEPWATGQGGTLAPITASRLRRFAEGLLRSQLEFAPYRCEIRRPEEYWLLDGITNLGAWRAVAEAGLVRMDEVVGDLASSYRAARRVSGVEHDLERLYSTNRDTELARRVEAPYVLTYLDKRIRDRSSGRTSLDQVIRRAFRGKHAESLWSSIEGTRRKDWDSFRDRFVRGKEEVPTEGVRNLAHTEPTPTPAAGNPVRALTVLVTGDTSGFLEHCGCKVNQSGGVARRATAIERLRREHPGAPLLDVGNAFMKPETGTELDYLSREEQKLYLQTMAAMHYDAAAIGPNELLHGVAWFREATSGLSLPYVSSNVLDHGAPLAPPSRTFRRNGLRIAVVSVLEPPHGPGAPPQFESSTADLTFQDPVTVASRAIADVRPRSDFVIVAGRLEPETVRRLIQASPRIDLVLSNANGTSSLVQSSGAPQTTGDEGFLGRTLVLYEDSKNYGLESVSLELDDSCRVASARTTHHWLFEDVPDDPAIRGMLTRFYERVGTRDSAQASVAPLFPGSAERQNGVYVGAARCAPCHRLEFDQWKTTRHATAYKTLLDEHRHYQPRCVVCHVVGFRTKHGYRLGDPEEPLANVQCEVCHGPGAAHSATPRTAHLETVTPESTCLECHNPQHSEAFVYSEKLPLVRHRESVAAR